MKVFISILVSLINTLNLGAQVNPEDIILLHNKDNSEEPVVIYKNDLSHNPDSVHSSIVRDVEKDFLIKRF